MLTDLDDFIVRAGLSRETWDKAACDLELLRAIGEDHQKHSTHLQESAEFFAKVLQRLRGVHSVRWRIKDAEHLIAKIIRKRAEGIEKYASVSTENYHQIVTDLIGVRALHLFKDDCIEIDAQLRGLWKLAEPPVVYIRDGEQGELTQKFAAGGFEIKCHPAGYRSVHYVIESRPLNRSVFAELQVRTIFEEAWSEIDHRVRYPNFSQSELVAYFLAIFNRLSGSADEMGGFVRGLASTLQDLEGRLARADHEKREALTAIEKTVTEMDAVRKRDKESGEQIGRLKAEIQRLKRSSIATSLGGLGMPGLLSNQSTPAVSSDAQLAIDRLLSTATPTVDLEKLFRMTPSIDFDKLASIRIPKIDIDRFNLVAESIEKWAKSAPSIDFDKLNAAAAASFTALERLGISNEHAKTSEKQLTPPTKSESD